MDTPSESIPEKEVPRPGEVFQVLDSPEVREAGGLAVRDFTESGGKIVSGVKHMEENVVRLPIGAQVTVEKAFRDSDGVWVIFNYPYLSSIQGEKTLRVCALVEGMGVKYMEQVEQSAKNALDELKKEIEAARGQN